MTIKELLAFCRDNGYEGDNTRASLKDWLSGDGSFIEFVGKDKKPMSFDALWPERVTKGITLSVAKNASEPDTVEVVEGGDAHEPEMEAAAPKARTVDTQAAKVKGIDAMLSEGKAFRIARPDVQAYKHRISNRARSGYQNIDTMRKERAVFDDVDRAEYLGAMFRHKTMQTIGRFDYAQKARDLDIITKGATGSINSQGGATFMGEFVPELILLLNEYSATRQLLNVRTPSGAPPYTYPRRTADPTMTWVGAGVAGTDQNPSYGNVAVNVGKMLGYMNVDNELEHDSAINIVDDLFNGFANAIGYTEDQAFFNGDGTSTYGGITGLLNAIGSAGVSTAAGDTWGEMTDAEFQATLGLLPGYAWRGTVKITCTPNAFYQIINRISRGMGGVTYTESQTGVVKPVYNGYPVIYNNVMAAATAISTKSVLVGEFDYAAKAVEIPGSLALESSDQYRFANDQIALRARERFGITVHDAGDSSNAGPVVAFATDAS
jgi:HK97 family phage major capsid protein